MQDDNSHLEISEADASRIKALKAGSAQVWRETLAFFGPGLLGYATRMLGDKSTAEEVVQDALVNIYRTIDRFDGRCSLKSWLYRAVRNRAIDEIRRQKRFVDVGEDPEKDFFNAAGDWNDDCFEWDGRAAKELDKKRLLSLVHKEINNLPHAHREVLLLKEIECLEKQEICAALEISAGNLRIRIHRARTALKAAIGYELAKEL
ncbi:MAG: sigma-70 family RNA polymerase sigma factor [Emcibacteraceae bacterium]|nr:sigma-70 family RNA polymerase sigma factor [Emcibacteraceae bacterium]